MVLGCGCPLNVLSRANHVFLLFFWCVYPTWNGQCGSYFLMFRKSIHTDKHFLRTRKIDDTRSIAMSLHFLVARTGQPVLLVSLCQSHANMVQRQDAVPDKKLDRASEDDATKRHGSCGAVMSVTLKVGAKGCGFDISDFSYHRPKYNGSLCLFGLRRSHTYPYLTFGILSTLIVRLST